MAIVTASAFGPYLGGGVRTEQVAVYLSFFAVALAWWPAWRQTQSDFGPVPVLFLWAAFVTIAIVGAALPPFNQTTFERGGTLAGLDNALLPLAMIVLVWFWTLLTPVRVIVTTASRVIVAAMLVNSVVAIASLARGDNEVLPFIRAFWAPQQADSVAERGVTNERYTGIFTQPAEAGVCYSLAIFALLYLAQASGRRRTGRLVLGGALLTAGGVLSVSKIFLFGGLPVILFALMWDRRRRWRALVGASAVTLGYWGLSTTGAVPGWGGGREQLEQYFDPSEASVTLFTAHRYGDGGFLQDVADQILEHNPWFGVGAGGLRTPYDSTWLEALVTVGIVGTVLIAVVFVALAVGWLRRWRKQPGPDWVFGGAVLVLAFGASFGINVLTANRASTLVWLLLGALILADRRPTPPGPRLLLRTRALSARADTLLARE